MTDIRNPLADALAEIDKVTPDGYTDQGEARPRLSRALWRLVEAVRQDVRVNQPGELRASGVLGDQWQSPVALAEDYARWAAEQMNMPEASDTEFIADGATVTAYVHGRAHMSATFTPGEGRPYPRGGSGEPKRYAPPF
jgi:hypothetical protein